MLKERLEQILIRSLAALWELAWLNRRMTAKGIVLAVVLVAAHYGFHVSADAQVVLATAVTLYIGLVGRDRQRRRIS